MNRTDTSAADLSHFARQGAARTTTTVPMPPRRWVSRVVLPIIILLCVLGILASAGLDGLLPTIDVRVIPVLMKSTTAATGGGVVQAPGWVEPDPYPRSVSALADGIVEEVLVLEGQSVKAGDVVARLIDADAKLALAHAESLVNQMKAAVQQAEAALEAAERTWENPVERVRARDQSAAMLNEAKAELEQLPAEIEVETARLREAEEKLNRIKRLYQNENSTGMEMIRAQADYDAQTATLKAKTASRPILEARVAQREAEATAAARNLGLRIEDKQQLADAKAALLKTQAELAHAGVTRDEAALRLSRMEIRSHTDGIVMNRLIEPGSKLLITMNDPDGSIALKTYDPSKLQVRVDVPLADAASVSVDQEAQVVVDVLPDRTFKGRVTRVVNEADVQKNTLQFKVAITDPEPRLRPEMLARVRILIPARAGAIEGPRQGFFIPAELVQGGDKEPFVMVTDRSGTRAERRMVTPGGRDEQGWIEIATGLQMGDQLLAGEATRLKEGTRIRVAGEVAGAPERGRRMAMIECRGISRVYQKGADPVVALDHVDIDIAAGEFVALMGPSGSGKTTLLNLIAGIDRPTAGVLSIDGRDIAKLSRSELATWRGEYIGYVFQLYNLVPVLTAYENVELPLLLHSLSRRDRHQRTASALELVGLSDRHDHYPRQLSGGQEQRVAIARAIVTAPKIIVADEPTGDLDAFSAMSIMALLTRLNAELGKTIVMVTHDIKTAAYAGRTVHLDKGRLTDEPSVSSPGELIKAGV